MTSPSPHPQRLPHRPDRSTAFWRAFRENRGAVVGMVVVVTILLVAIFASVIAPHDPIEQYKGFTKLPPFWMEGSDSRFLLGTDAVGRDMLSRLMYGARVSLFIGIAVMAVSMVFGIALGLAAALFGGIVDVVIIRVMDLIMAIPSLVLAILIIAIIGPNLTNTIIAVTIVGLPRYVRLVRASALTELTKDYVTAAQGRRRRAVAADDRHGAAQLPGAPDRAGGTRRVRCHPRSGRPGLPRARRPAADARMGRHAGRYPRPDDVAPLGHGVSRPRHPDHRAGHQPDGRRPARRARSRG